MTPKEEAIKETMEMVEQVSKWKGERLDEKLKRKIELALSYGIDTVIELLAREISLDIKKKYCEEWWNDE